MKASGCKIVSFIGCDDRTNTSRWRGAARESWLGYDDNVDGIFTNTVPDGRGISRGGNLFIADRQGVWKLVKW
jgi:hypothetical protein